MTNMDTLRVDLGSRSYDILAGNGLLAVAGEYIAPLLAQPRVIIVTDETVAALHLPDLKQSLEGADIQCDTIILPPGEQTKCFEQVQSLTETIVELGIDRDTTLIAFGGGVVGDLVGFTAAITLRGMPFVQIPTTLLSQVDSSVGGKTGINIPQGKNLVGAFHQPQLVLADTRVLSTLPRREILAGLAEVIKYGLINDPEFFSWLETSATLIRDGDEAASRKAVMTSCAAKAAVVSADEKEHGQRALLNLGHTFGHALEAEVGYGGALLHGEAVAIGTMMAFDLSVHLGFCPAEQAERAQNMFRSLGLPVDLSGIDHTGWTAELLIGHMWRDKKVKSGKLTLILTHGIGKAFVTSEVAESDIFHMLEKSLCV